MYKGWSLCHNVKIYIVPYFHHHWSKTRKITLNNIVVNQMTIRVSTSRGSTFRVSHRYTKFNHLFPTIMTVQYYILLVMFQQISSLIYENICT